MSEEIDDVGRETAAMLRTMLQIATLVALKTRERGQREAEARVKITEARLKEARELQIREAREAKARDPRNQELAQMLSRPLPDTAARIAPHREEGAYRGVSLEKDRFSLSQTVEAFAEAASGGKDEQPGINYDSVERRTALAAHLARIGVEPELAAARMLVEVGQAKPASEAARTRPEYAPAVQRAREQELGRGLERTR